MTNNLDRDQSQCFVERDLGCNSVCKDYKQMTKTYRRRGWGGGEGQPLINELQSTVALLGVRYMNLLSYEFTV